MSVRSLAHWCAQPEMASACTGFARPRASTSAHIFVSSMACDRHFSRIFCAKLRGVFRSATSDIQSFVPDTVKRCRSSLHCSRQVCSMMKLERPGAYIRCCKCALSHLMSAGICCSIVSIAESRARNSCANVYRLSSVDWARLVNLAHVSLFSFVRRMTYL